MRITVTGLEADLPQRIQRQVADIIEEEVLDFGVVLERNSPRGASSPGDSLVGSYEIKPAVITSDELKVGIENTLPFSFERLAGRGPGKPPPVSKLERWARSKGISPFVVARKIGQVGTDRYIEGEDGNILQANPRTKQIPRDRGPQKETTDRMVQRISQLRY